MIVSTCGNPGGPRSTPWSSNPVSTIGIWDIPENYITGPTTSLGDPEIVHEIIRRIFIFGIFIFYHWNIIFYIISVLRSDPRQLGRLWGNVLKIYSFPHVKNILFIKEMLLGWEFRHFSLFLYQFSSVPKIRSGIIMYLTSQFITLNCLTEIFLFLTALLHFEKDMW